MKNKSSDASEVVILERCWVVEFGSKADVSIVLKFQSGEPDLYLEAASKPDCESWAVALGEANSEGLRHKIQQLRRLIMEIKEERSADEARQFLPPSQADSLGEPQFTSIQRIANEPKLEFSLACKDLVAATRDRKLNTFIQVSVVHPAEHILTRYSSTEIVEGTRDPLFLTGVTFPPEYPIYEETKIKLTVYDVKDKSQDTVRTSVLPDHKEPRADVGRSFLGCATFRVGDLVKSKEQQLTLTLRTSDGGKAVGTIEVNLVKMGELEDGETDHITTDTQDQKCALVRECMATEGISGKDNLPSLNAVLKNPICKLYRFPTSDNKWMRIREQMTETTLSFHVPKELINLHIKEDMRRNQELKDLGELAPHWDNMRKSVIAHCDQMLSMYQDTLAELGKHTGSSFKSSCSKGEKTLEFIPINLHLQRMHVHSPRLKDALYDVITVGAPAAHFQGFKNGGLRKLLSKFEAERRNTGYQCIYYSPENTAKAKEVLSNINHLQPLISSHADLLLSSASQRSPDSLKNSLKMLSEKTELFVHAFKDQLVRSALLALYTARPGCVLKKPAVPRNSAEEGGDSQHQDHPSQIKRQDSIPHHSEYDEEEWDRVWANVAKSLNCVIAMVDRLLEKDNISSIKEDQNDPSAADCKVLHTGGDWYEQLYPLVITLKDCMGEVVTRAKQSMAFVLLQELACGLPQCLMLTLRRDIVFSQALAGLVCGFIIKLHTGLHDQGFLQQLHTVGLLVQYEGLLSTYSEEAGMLEDMAVGISDLQKVMFKVIEAKSEDFLPIITGRREHYIIEVQLPAKMFELLPQEIKEGKLLRMYPVLFNVGINEQQTLAERFGDTTLQENINQENLELLKEYYKLFTEKMPPDCLPHFQEQNDLKGLLENLHQNIQAKRRKNVEIMWLAATICRKLNGVRFTCCKSAKDRTSMSVTLEQCSILRDEHQLHKDFFIRALDCMRSRQTQGALNESDDPETGCLTDNKPTSRHFYPVALLLVSSHLLVVWLILSLALLLAKYQ
ncbi:PREDICTED: type II inositol 3,4-bisphosphate 4-phosphatase isoform X2 [Lepidothrix coronata]|uniref:phosphatidylinositol-3,4-bisphosphate 4-phosphatase n=2 Tax=Lepidothrix coronata TaxID=321398 RepID=A0A6J0HP31_9PASS|nr:PREDICTED: type II inositol 3,4-bisphosphate 4-phosphatase isoform X2 [Lepidothrix coronata]XP_017675855.1 PREDICTED: type II inositol 3,4-bisphosphate 4-phosphatase isoform X2 [Lepidothrix coronata]XP_017675856.1 PREDICTED: type II inositol 3,4-bisphosphate 4-phosphatase isoform X2 [Lepidothrix coronata]XP_017675857.1 PREDICTED: type II inositol 3,4-bisphosphate 4-phosphatase isoform X2 [Lepidothrix coronata]XP_017675858.1 PREDICTED: type II inositol 3,4-bisphosphate 4-phosphatase isoform X